MGRWRADIFVLAFLLHLPCSKSSQSPTQLFHLDEGDREILALAANEEKKLFLLTTKSLYKLDASTSPAKNENHLQRETKKLHSFQLNDGLLSICADDLCQAFEAESLREVSPPLSLASLDLQLPFTFLHSDKVSLLGGLHREWKTGIYADVTDLPADLWNAHPNETGKGVYGLSVHSVNGTLKAPEYGLLNRYRQSRRKEAVEIYPSGQPMSYLGSFAHGDYIYILRNLDKEETVKAAVHNQHPEGKVRRASLELAQMRRDDVWLRRGGETEDSLPTWINLELRCGRMPSPADAFVLLPNATSSPPSLVTFHGPGDFCAFEMEALEAAFQNVYDECQSRDSTFEYLEDGEEFPVISRGRTGGSYCLKQSCETKEKMERSGPMALERDQMCRSSIRLDSFQPLVANQSAMGMELAGRVRKLLPANSPRSVFALVSPTRNAPDDYILYKILFADTNEAAKPTSFRVPFLETLGEVVTSVGDSIVSGEGEKMRRQSLACEQLLSKCEDFQAPSAQGFLRADPSQCVWCVGLDGRGDSRPRAACAQDRQRLRSLCPPRPPQNLFVRQETNTNGSSILNIRFQGDAEVRVHRVSVCGHNCSLLQDSADTRCQFERSSEHIKDCETKIWAEYWRGGGQRHSLEISRQTDFEGELQVGGNRQGLAGLGMPHWLGVLAGLFLLILLLSLVFVWLCRRGRGHKRERVEVGGLEDDVGGARLPRAREGNTYGGHVAPLPGSEAVRAYEDMSYLVPEKLRIAYSSIDFASEIGSGHFGVVYKAIYVRPSQPPLTVAVKTLNSPTGVREFLREGLRMENFEHERVMGLLGITFLPDNNYPMIVTPFMPRGDLLSFLQNPDSAPTLRQMLNFAVEIAEGMAYLHKIKFIHRDLAARNCMLDENLHVRISDFGLSRDVYNEDGSYAPRTERFMPLRWLAPEGVERWSFTYKGDVWAYGVTVWEICTRGLVPYHQLLTGYEVLSFLKEGRRLGKPEFCPESLYRVMLSCWAADPASRPAFSELCLAVPAVIAELQSHGKSLQIPLHHSYINYPPESLQGQSQML